MENVEKGMGGVQSRTLSNEIFNPVLILLIIYLFLNNDDIITNFFFS